MRLLSNKTILCYHIEVKKKQKLGKVQKLQQLSGSCQEGLPEGCSRAREGEGPEARRKRAGHFADVRVTPTFLRLRFFTEHHRITDEHVLLGQHRCGSASAIPIKQ